MSQRRMTEVSSPPEYASTTLFTGVFMAPLSVSQEAQDDALLGVQPVLRLVQDDAPGPVQDRVRDLLPAMRRQTVHDEGLPAREPEQRLVDLVALECLLPPLALLLLPHADPHIRVDHIRPLDGLAGLHREGDPPAERPAGVHHGRMRLVARRRADRDGGAG